MRFGPAVAVLFVVGSLLAALGTSMGMWTEMRERAEKAEAALAAHICSPVRFTHLRLRIVNGEPKPIDSTWFVVGWADTTNPIPLVEVVR